MFSLVTLVIPVLVIGGIVAMVVVAVNRGRRHGEVSGSPLSPKFVFLYLLTTATLYIASIGVLVLIWGLAEHWFPEPYAGFSYGNESGAVRGGVSMAIVAFPIFVYLSLLVRRKIKSGEIEPGSTVRTGFLYFNLFLIAVAVLITLMVTVSSFLGGDLTPRFMVRAGGVLVIVGLVYLYYRSELETASGSSEAPKLEV